MKFIQRKPHPALREYIQGYWLIQSTGLTEPLDMLVPDGYPEMFFVLQESLEMPHFSGNKRWNVQSEGGLIGQVTSSFSFQTAPFSNLLFVKLYPWTPYWLFGVPSWQINDQAIDLGAITNDPSFRQLGEELRSGKSLNEMVALLDAFFLKKRMGINTGSSFLQFAVQQIYASEGTVNIDSLRRHVHASRRYVEKVFKDRIGLSPKRFAQLIRVKKASMYLLDPRFNASIRDVAHRLEYFDQSHLLKDFKAIMGQSPSTYLRKQIHFSKSDLLSYLDQWDYS